MKRNLIICAALAIALAGAWLATSGEGEVRNAGAKQGPIVAFGDSLVAGVGATKGNDLVSLLSRRAGETIANMGVPGDTTASALARVDAAVARSPRAVIVLLGGNDFLRRVPRAETFANLEAIVSEMQESGAAVLLLGVRGDVLGSGAADEYEALAERTGSAYVPDVLDGLFGDNRYMSDGIHPNDAGYARIAERVYPQLERVMR